MHDEMLWVFAKAYPFPITQPAEVNQSQPAKI